MLSADALSIVTASADKTARLWNAVDGTEIAVLKGHENSVDIAMFSSDGTRIVTSSYDSARLWSASDGRQIEVFKGHRDHINNVVFGPKGQTVATVSSDITQIWNASNGAKIADVAGATKVYFSPDAQLIMTLPLNNTVRLWSAANGLEIAVLSGHTDRVNSGRFSPNEEHIVTASFDKTARIWPYYSKVQTLIDCAKEIVPRCLDRSQRKKFYLSPEPPRWCITGPGLEAETESANWQPKWPYHTDIWRQWLVAKDRGEEPPLPEK